MRTATLYTLVLGVVCATAVAVPQINVHVHIDDYEPATGFLTEKDATTDNKLDTVLEQTPLLTSGGKTICTLEDTNIADKRSKTISCCSEIDGLLSRDDLSCTTWEIKKFLWRECALEKAHAKSQRCVSIKA